jgi:hypothetical protein
MTQAFDAGNEHPLRRPRVVWLALGAGAAAAVLLVALSLPRGDRAAERSWVDTAPSNGPSGSASETVAALDAGVDWRRVDNAADFGPAAVAAYER